MYLVVNCTYHLRYYVVHNTTINLWRYAHAIYQMEFQTSTRITYNTGWDTTQQKPNTTSALNLISSHSIDDYSSRYESIGLPHGQLPFIIMSTHMWRPSPSKGSTTGGYISIAYAINIISFQVCWFANNCMQPLLSNSTYCICVMFAFGNFRIEELLPLGDGV